MKEDCYDLIIRNGQIVTEEGIFQGDIAVHEQRIVKIGFISTEKKAKKEIDAVGLHVFPGLIDTHVHFNEPGRTEWEGLATGSQSLAAGGVTTFFDMPLNSSPPTTTAQGFERKKQAAEQSSILDYGLWGGLVPGNLDSLEHLKKLGVIGFKGFMSNSGIDEFLHVDDSTLFKGMQKIAGLGSILALHAESDVITNQLADWYKAQGRRTARDYAASRPVLSEIEAVGRAASYAEITGCKLHIVHASSGEVVKRISEAKQRGVDITVETCPHYLAFTTPDLERLGGVAKCAPPLREQEHVESLWEALKSGEIDSIGSDHSPSPPAMKVASDNDDFFSLWGGISGAQTTLNVMLEEGYWRRNLPLEVIARVTAANPAKRFGLYPRKGTIAVGSDADLALVDLQSSFVLKETDLFYRHRQSPYIGKTFRGMVMFTILHGRVVFQKGEGIDNNFFGQMV
ncbi:allantoinase [Fodinisporobacter ferrooxydans]|uniref:Allantoinase n=1 Tax=Fodinisporobacter ferrooxydans TaxID=2901836 RepID=A0ABY4CT06_9BACL|nr:allantoinase [Alicyclobacillaceae bacterium MYW30-H2]